MGVADRDKFLTEAMGECWHEEKYRYDSFTERCRACDTDSRDCIRSDFSTWDGFGRLFGWAQEQEWWGMGSPFWAGYTAYPSHGLYKIGEAFVHPDRCADALYVFLKARV